MAALFCAAGAVLVAERQVGWAGVSLAGVLMALGAYLAIVMPAEIRSRRARVASRGEPVRATTPAPDADVPVIRLVRDVPLAGFGVHPSRLDLPFQTRNAAAELTRALAAGEPVLLYGPSMSGKSRLGAEILQEMYGDRPVWIARQDELPRLVERGVPDGVAVWLEDLERFLSVTTLRTDWVEVLTAAGAHVVATIRSHELSALLDSSEIRVPQAASIELFTHVQVRDDDPAENARLARSLNDDRAAAAVTGAGLGAYLGGGILAVSRFTEGRDSHPLGTAMVRAAADWRRICQPAVDRIVLAELAVHYLPAAHRNSPGESAEEALDWATDRVQEGVQLLTIAGTNAVTCSNYILDRVEEQYPLR